MFFKREAYVYFWGLRRVRKKRKGYNKKQNIKESYLLKFKIRCKWQSFDCQRER